MYGLQRLRALEGSQSGDASYLEHRQDLVLGELERRRVLIERHRDDPRAPRWPARKQYTALVDLARELKQTYPLNRFIDDHILTTHLQRTGDRWRGNCPIPDHGDSSPSFTVYADDHWHCFGCGRHGDVFTLISLVYGFERFTDQVRYLADCVGHEVAS
jgi:hypothetical protein